MIKKSKASIHLPEAGATQHVGWFQDKEFIAELDERVKRYKDGVDRGHTWEELESAIEDLKKSTK